MFLLRPPDFPPRSPLAPGVFDPGNEGEPSWKPGDTGPLHPWREGHLQGWALEGYEALSLEAVPWERLRWERIEHWRQVKKASIRRVVSHRSPDNGDTFFFKWVQIRGAGKILGGAFRHSKAAREFALARRLLVSGFLTPTPLLFAERRAGPFLREAFLVTRGLDPAWESVRNLWKQLFDADKEKAIQIIEDLGRAVRAFHDHGLYFADSRSHHWYMRTSHTQGSRSAKDQKRGSVFRKWAVLDLDASRLGAPPSPAAREHLLAMLAASMPWSRWTPDHTRRLVESYLGLTPHSDIVRRVEARARRIHNKGGGQKEPRSRTAAS